VQPQMKRLAITLGAKHKS